MKDWIDSIEARTKAQTKYDKKNTVGFYMKLNIHTDQDVIRWLWSQTSKQGAIKELIRKEISRNLDGKAASDGNRNWDGHTGQAANLKGETRVCK